MDRRIVIIVVNPWLLANDPSFPGISPASTPRQPIGDTFPSTDSTIQRHDPLAYPTPCTSVTVADLIGNVSGVLRDLVPAMALLHSVIYTFGSVAVSVFFYVFHKAQL
jgi:hypothetical protein